jgi:Cys-rich repeat protein
MLQNFGTALSREQMKNVKGGLDELQDAGFDDENKCTTCSTNSDCKTGAVCNTTRKCCQRTVVS